MRRKGLIFLGVVSFLFIMLTLQGCKSQPEKGLLERYFHAISLRDTMTMSTMAFEPTTIDVQSWEILNVSEERISPATLPELNLKEMELKKKLEEHVGPVMDAEDALYAAQEELKAARTSAAKAAAKKKADEMQAEFDRIRENHRELQRQYNEAKSAAQKEQEISIFSLGAGEVPNIRDLTGTVHSKDVDLEIMGKDGQARTYRFHLKRYELKDETLNLTRRGRWVIVKFEPIS
ncbi:MAG: hypothetical protein FJY81_05825 [Candidatus Aminicenantes bacterium]|nr:hypothetical protein [Candidatus Aminicenantes bacterium]